MECVFIRIFDATCIVLRQTSFPCSQAKIRCTWCVWVVYYAFGRTDLPISRYLGTALFEYRDNGLPFDSAVSQGYTPFEYRFSRSDVYADFEDTPPRSAQHLAIYPTEDADWLAASIECFSPGFPLINFTGYLVHDAP